MKRVLALLLLMAGMAGAEMRPLPTAEGWDADPMTWKLRTDGIHCTLSNGHGIAVCQAAPLASNVTVEAVFTPLKAVKSGWEVAAIAIVDDARNFLRWTP